MRWLLGCPHNKVSRRKGRVFARRGRGLAPLAVGGSYRGYQSGEEGCFLSITGNWDRRISRQKFLGISGMSAAALVLGAQGVWLPRRGLAQTITDSNPFKPLGVASGDPLPNSVVLWTRLAPDPLNGGGMPDGEVTVDW